MTARIRPIVLVEDDELSFNPATTAWLEMVLYGWEHEQHQYPGAISVAANHWGFDESALEKKQAAVIPIPGSYDLIPDVWAAFVDLEPNLETVIGVQKGDFCWFALAPGLYSSALEPHWKYDRGWTWSSAVFSWGTPSGSPSNGGFAMSHTHPGATSGLSRAAIFHQLMTQNTGPLADDSIPTRAALWRGVIATSIHEFTHMLGIPHALTHNGKWNDPDVNHVFPQPPGLSRARLEQVQDSILFHDSAHDDPPPDEDTEEPPPDEDDDGTPPPAPITLRPEDVEAIAQRTVDVLAERIAP